MIFNCVENNIHGGQTFTYKVIKYLNSTEKDTESLNSTQENKWIKHYANLRTSENGDCCREEDEEEIKEVEHLTMGDLF